ncbi:MAG: hypothetical protein CMH90_07390 [Oceanicaulis sp.]|uniref:helix-turn-helix domain-containing protein n=1 Tax=Oceanicaulis sp. UBA2681 TaxID=1947007 RepID=UPI000C08DE7B|nr:helix-turn-helix domain-containing protein [Oceanicaulis sp. UBA2681]MAP49286.1 hypothetical protein [Oceanicaulis sp.]|tara:strand:+ start:17097 stop:18179 length:1083 start_codon:yes stop_codon:yes gene_type:complete
MSILTGFMCVLLACFLVLAPNPRTLPNRFLAAFLLLTAIELSGWLWVDASNQAHWSNALRLALGKLQMPVFLGFFLASCYADFRLRARDALHLIPMAIALWLALPGDQLHLSAGETSSANLSPAEQTAFTVGSHLLYYGYMAMVIWVLVRFWALYRNQHAAGRSQTLLWLTQLAGASLFAHTLILLRDVLNLSLAHAVVLPLQLLGAVLALGITTWIALKSLLHPELFRDVDRRLLSLTPRSEEPQSPDLQRVLAYMEAQTPYLDPDLNLARLSDQLAMTPREVSELLNQSHGVHFFDFINRYRVRHAQALLEAQDGQSVLQILHASGFNSKSSFNTAFKKHTGLTPSAYRKNFPTLQTA